MLRAIAIEAAFLVAVAGCAAIPQESVVPGSIGIAVAPRAPGVEVKDVGTGSPAAVAGVRAGDIVLRYNGQAVADTRRFHGLVVDSRPGSVARLEVLRDGAVYFIDVIVEQLDTTPRV